jgi:Flp pilus assembly pilin Flp
LTSRTFGRTIIANLPWAAACPVGYQHPTALKEQLVKSLLRLVRDEQGQDIAEYAVMLAVILVLVVGTIRLVGSNANNAFSQAASSIQ